MEPWGFIVQCKLSARLVEVPKAQGRPEQINKIFISDLLQCGITCLNQHIPTEKMEARAARCIMCNKKKGNSERLCISPEIPGRYGARRPVVLNIIINDPSTTLPRLMPPLRFLTSILFLYLSLAVNASSLTTTIAPNERVCFYADVDKAGEKIGVCAHYSGL